MTLKLSLYISVWKISGLKSQTWQVWRKHYTTTTSSLHICLILVHYKTWNCSAERSASSLFLNLKKAYWMNNIAVSCTYCYSCQMCPNGIRTSSIMTLVCFKLFALSLSVCLPFRNWACWLLSMRRVASPKAQTTPFWRNYTVDTQWVHTHTWKPTWLLYTCSSTLYPSPTDSKAIKMTHIRAPKLLNPSWGNAFTAHQLRQPQRVKPLSWLMNRLLHWMSVQHSYTPPGAPAHEHNNTEMWSAILWVWPALCAGEKSFLWLTEITRTIQSET